MLQTWFLPTVLSAFLLGFYDITKKHALRNNAVMPVLFCATLCGSAFFIVVTAITGKLMELLPCTGTFFLLILLKSAIVATSWTCVYYAMRDLPISIASPIRASSPLGVFLGGLILFHEVPNLWQGLAMIAIFAGYFGFSVIGKMEGFAFRNSRSVHLIFIGTLIGAGSALYDKYLMNVRHFDPQSVQLWFSIDLVILLGAGLLYRMYLCKTKPEKFHWKWTVPATGVLLILADFTYFYAISQPEAHISMLSLVRRASCVISFAGGSLLFKDQHILRKALALLLILLGVIALGLAK